MWKCRNKITPDCVYLECESWDLLHKNPAEVLNFGGAERRISMQDIFSCRIQMAVGEVAVTHSSRRCANLSQHCQQRGILFSIFCRSTHHNTSPSASAQAIFHTMLHITPSRTTMERRKPWAPQYCCAAPTSARRDSKPRRMIHAFPIEFTDMQHPLLLFALCPNVAEIIKVSVTGFAKLFVHESH